MASITIEPLVFDPDLVTVVNDGRDSVAFTLGRDRTTTTVSVLRGGSPDTTLFGVSSFSVDSRGVTKTVLTTAVEDADYRIEAPEQDSPEANGKGTMTGTIKVGGRMLEKAL